MLEFEDRGSWILDISDQLALTTLVFDYLCLSFSFLLSLTHSLSFSVLLSVRLSPVIRSICHSLYLLFYKCICIVL